MHQIRTLPIAVRVYPQPSELAENNSLPADGRGKRWRRPDAVLVFDTETRIDATQKLTFGSYRFFIGGVCQEEGLFFGVDLPERDRAVLEQYVEKNVADALNKRLKLLTLQQFISTFYKTVYKGRCLLVGFNLPFDLSRLARGFATARGRFAGGFSLVLSSYVDGSGSECENRYRPRIAIKHIDGKRALKGFTARHACDPSDLIPEGSSDGAPEDGYKFRGHFLDLRTLAFALTDRGYTLATACDAFKVEHGKQLAERHGTITNGYIDYNRRDVLATAELASKLLEEYDKHPIRLQPTKAYSPASIGKAYLQAMGIRPILERQPDFPREYLGYSQSAFFGGRTSAHIRKTPAPVVYTDFLSMYPTVNSLMGLWQFVTARKIEVIDHCQSEIAEFLHRVTVDFLFTQDAWKHLAAFVRIIPNGDILPSRSKYSTSSNDWQLAVNHIYSNPDRPDGLWYALPDVVASVILSGRIPQIIDAFRLKPIGSCKELKPVSLRGTIEVDPRTEDFFKVVIEERKRLDGCAMAATDKGRLEKALKIIANATSYGIYAEMNRQESEEKISVVCHGMDSAPFTCRVVHAEVPGKYCFPPVASLITSAARLMLALLERCVFDMGGTYAMEDTDSMAIVATRQGGLIHCPGGPNGDDTNSAVRALSWKQVREISSRFTALNPYDPKAIPGSILKIENDNHDPVTGKQRQLYCLAISAKRYSLFLKERNGVPQLLCKGVNSETDRWSEHGLGHLLNPTDPESEDRKWIAQAWLSMIRRALNYPAQPLGFENRPAVGRVTVSSPAVAAPFAKLNEGKPYVDQIKPFNFLLACHVKPFGHPRGADPERFHLIAPYSNNANQWLRMDWLNRYTEDTFKISTSGNSGTRRTAQVKTYGDVLREYEFHPESKSSDSSGNSCNKQTIGLLQRQHIVVDHIRYIGKESNHLEAVDAGLVHHEEGVYTEYEDTSRNEWQTNVVPALKRMRLDSLVQKSGLSRRALLDIRSGRSRPHANNQLLLRAIIDQE